MTRPLPLTTSAARPVKPAAADGADLAARWRAEGGPPGCDVRTATRSRRHAHAHRDDGSSFPRWRDMCKPRGVCARFRRYDSGVRDSKPVSRSAAAKRRARGAAMRSSLPPARRTHPYATCARLADERREHPRWRNSCERAAAAGEAGNAALARRATA